MAGDELQGQLQIAILERQAAVTNIASVQEELELVRSELSLSKEQALAARTELAASQALLQQEREELARLEAQIDTAENEANAVDGLFTTTLEQITTTQGQFSSVQDQCASIQESIASALCVSHRMIGAAFLFSSVAAQKQLSAASDTAMICGQQSASMDGDHVIVGEAEAAKK